MRISFRYKGKITDEGVHSRFFKKNLVGDRSCFRGTLKLPKPWNNAELAMLSKFIYGLELSVRFEYCEDKLVEAMKKVENYSRFGKSNSNFDRYLKLRQFDPNKKDYIPKSAAPSFIRTNGDKMILVYLRYFCNQNHNDIYDGRFNHVVFNSCYELDSYFWRHCIGEVSCGGISDVSYGQVEVTSFKERDRIMNLFKNSNQPVRRSFRKQIEKLIELDKEYDKYLKIEKV